MLRVFALLISFVLCSNCSTWWGSCKDKSKCCPKSEKTCSKDVKKCEACCKIAKENGTGWCDKCNMGLIDGKPVSCKGCVDAAKTGGKCEKCSNNKPTEEQPTKAE